MQPPRIQVVIRKRPINQKEIAKQQVDIISAYQGTTIVVREPKQKLDLTKYINQHAFHFDGALGEEASNLDLYQLYVRPILRHVFTGNKSTVFAFGQTGSGKTYTMNGNQKKNVIGLYEYSAYDIFESLNHSYFKDFTANCTFYEVYCGKIYDLLNDKAQLKVFEDKRKDIQVTGGVVMKLESPVEMLKYVKAGMSLRTTSKNSTNIQSSRSHSILQVSICQGNRLFGQISFIDLAGCERGADTIDMGKQTKVDGAQINKSLLALKECIRAMDNNKKHVPFRGSKLTLILRDSFGDNCKTLMIGNISPGSASCENTLNTLRYSETVKELKQAKQPLSKQGMKAKELMLTRNQKNTISIVPMEQQVVGFRLSVKNPPTKNSQHKQQNNINYRNVHSTTQNYRKAAYPKLKQDPHTTSTIKKAPSFTTEPLTHYQVQDWEHSRQLVNNWNIQNQPIEQYEQLIVSMKAYLDRQLRQYLSLSNEIIQTEEQLNQSKVDVLRQMYSSQNSPNAILYDKSLQLRNINQQRIDLITKQEIKLRSYMTHLQWQQESQRKMKQAQQMQYVSHYKKNDDQMSMIDEIQSEWSDELFSYDQPQAFNRPVTRQSVNLQREHSGLNLVRSFDYRP